MTDMDLLRELERRIDSKLIEVNENEIEKKFKKNWGNYYSINCNNITGLSLSYINKEHYKYIILNLKNLKYLCLLDNQINDISVLKDLKSLTHLDLRNNQINDISVLKDLKSLISLNLYSNQITNISALKELKSLTFLYLGLNQINDISALKELKSLTDLDLGNNQIKILPKWITDSNYCCAK
ncbi:MAG: hypothetical protein A2Y34_05960 [Spirochaetes bacterium GWC1_27_15]|nr:MAG: hypothetical protein A2Z98_17145 [Spirochaetes bacterium GWB1_27_13]OHD22331.1 MAG: hypothetical protein A2Y34_05960 [Spirochaetes bacterium GWC1_27_15]